MATYDLTQTIPTKFAAGDIINCPYTGAVKNISLPKGKYKLEVWGAQGGDANSTYVGGKGGYSVGQITLIDAATLLYLRVGGKGKASTGSSSGGFNGGGNAYDGVGWNTGSGGGGSDIRIAQDSLYARVIVAGGGGGANGYVGKRGGAGGGVSGERAAGWSEGGVNGGTQTSGGTSSVNGGKGSLGYGGSSTLYCGAGGGGGWYGGAGSDYYEDYGYIDGYGNWEDYWYFCCGGGAGGSGYVYNSSTASNYPSGCLLNESYYLTDSSTTIGTSAFISPTGTSETGHQGDGYIRITVIEAAPPFRLFSNIDHIQKECAAFCKINGTIKAISSGYVKIDNTWKPIS